MCLWDQHLHSNHSFDCQTPPEDNVRAAIDRGLSGLTFTEHFDPHPEEWRECIYDHEAYTRTIHRLRNEFGDRIAIGQGVEVGYYRERLDFTLDFLSEGDFDLVILSLHAIDHRLLHHRQSWDGLSVADASRRYFEHLLEAVDFCRSTNAHNGTVFNVLGHLDLVKRYSHRFFGQESIEEHIDLIDRILRLCLEARMVPEINTSTLRQGLKEPMPGLILLKQWSRIGGTCVSLGSDAHRAADVGAGFEEAIRIARLSGLTELSVFEKRCLRTVKIGNLNGPTSGASMTIE